jgi:hypothetical protein
MDWMHRAGEVLDSGGAVPVKLREFEESMVQVVTGAKKLRDDVCQAAQTFGEGLDEVSAKLSAEMAVILEELKTEFPPPAEAPGHEERLKMISHIMKKIEKSLVRVGGLYGLSEMDVTTHFRVIEPHVTNVLVVTGQSITFCSSMRRGRSHDLITIQAT